ncbi:BamA/TamA family outer membrane protein [Aureisphaera galaxeae]|nr:BamA/TamA family outer membrane protein [Aureisphaera galaxeae]MDC8003246.1 BamA/TamA family outer membrane protein [Aureisphaera galaxeae]
MLLFSCNTVKHVKENELLLTENAIVVDGEEVNDSELNSLINQKPNPKIPVLGVPFGLHFYNMAEEKPDSTFQDWLHRKPKRLERLSNLISRKQVEGIGRTKVNIHDWIKRTGSAPVVIEERKTKKSLRELKRYYFTQGWFNVDGTYKIEKDTTQEKRGSITYNITKRKPYFIDSISEKISSPIVDSLFQLTKENTFIVPGKQYNANDFVNERDRLNIQFRNSGLYYFDQDYIGFDADTNNTGHKVHIDYIIPNRRIAQGDSTISVPFQIHKINEVRIVTDAAYANRDSTLTDSTTYAGYKLFSYDKLKYRPKAITNAVSITPGEIFRDIDRTLTYNQLRELRNFRYPNISYRQDPNDSTGTGLIASILLTPKKKYTASVDFDAYTSTIQQFGIGFSGSFLIRNVFRGAENLEISASGSVGASKDNADSDSSFFNTSDVGADVKLTLPSILFPVNTNKIIPKYMSPFTSISVGINAQNNIGLDRQNFNGIFSYRWKPQTIRTNQFDLVNVQYVRNLNTNNYFNVYQTSYDQLNEIAQNSDYVFEDGNSLGIPTEADNFIQFSLSPDNPLSLDDTTLDELRSINQRQDRLTEDNLIFASTFNWSRDTREGIYDFSWSRFRWKVEAAGNLLSTIASSIGLEKNEDENFETFGVVFSQYVKFETDYIKHWELNNNSIFAIRAFGGIAIPYGNSNSIPFTRSYFAGGANDNRGWRAYDLGPGSSGGILDFNEANLKLALNAEYRYTILGGFKGAFFIDAGNIWNVLDNEEREAFKFNDFSDLSELAVASGLGLRYDFGFFVLRFDVGFKTYDPARTEGQRWFKDYNFKNSVLNIGINYPF